MISTIKTTQMAKDLHGLMTKEQEMCRFGEHINTDDLRIIKNCACDIVEMAEEIRKIQDERA